MTKPNDERDTADLAAIAQGMLTVTRCPGGRYMVKGYFCVHCGVDTSDDPGFCGQPVTEDGYTPFDTTVARRIMRESEEKFDE